MNEKKQKGREVSPNDDPEAPWCQRRTKAYTVAPRGCMAK